MKYCPLCEKQLPLDSFYRHKLTKDGRNTYCKSCTKVKSSVYQKENKSAVNKKNRIWQRANRKKTASYLRKYRANNPGFSYECNKRHMERYPWKNAFDCMKRHTGKIKRTPPYADMDAIKFFYECCPKGCHVDHVIPLRGRNISGFHIETNLQWLPAEQNISKSNSWTGY